MNHAALARRLNQLLLTHPFKGSVRLKFLLCRILLPAPQGPQVTQTIYGFPIHIDPSTDRGLEESLYYCGTYEPGTLRVMAACLRAGDTMIDVGSNIGLMAIFASRIVGNTGCVHAIEPNPETIPLLRQNIALNRADNIRVHALAFGSMPRDQDLYRGIALNRGAASLVAPAQRDAPVASVRVQTCDEFIAQNVGAPPRFVKIDVEGWELPVLEGARQLLSIPAAPILCVEYNRATHTSAQDLQDVYEHILSFQRYQIFKLAHGKESIGKLVRIQRPADLPAHDNLFCFLPAQLDQVPRDLFASARKSKIP
ncbi:MAG: FkbM family methyltransferase [Chloroflexi bacterium]|nr:FkbM family methyltransferase [Chloroflexota bacterium]